MNRINTILICITAVVIFYILKQEQKEVDLSPYLDKIQLLEQKVDSLHSQNSELKVEADSLVVKIGEYDKKIKGLNWRINVIKKETQAKLDSIDKFGNDELERFFAERYGYDKDSIN